MLQRLMGRLLVVLSALALISCASLQELVREPEVSVEGMEIAGISLVDMQLDFRLGVRNPNPLAVSLQGLSYRLDIEEHRLLEGRQQQKLKVAANASSSVSLPLRINYRDLLGGIEALYRQETIRYTLAGEIDFGLLRLPYSKSGVIRLPSLPTIRLERLSVERMTLGGMEVVLAMQIGNDNSFPIRLDGLEYDLTLAGTRVAGGRSMGAVALPPGKHDSLNLALTLDYGDLPKVVRALTSRSSVPVVFDGRVRLPGGESVPLKWRGDVAIAR